MKQINPIARISATNIMENTNLNNEQFTNPLLNPLNHSIEELLKEIKFGRPAETQLQIQKWIDEFNKNKQETIEETCDRLFPTAAIEWKIVKGLLQEFKKEKGL